MAVLKSPRNNKNKRRWSQTYALSFQQQASNIPKWVNPKDGCKLYRKVTFLKVDGGDTAYNPSLALVSPNNPFTKPKQGSPLPSNFHFQNLTNTTRIFHPLIFSKVV